MQHGFKPGVRRPEFGQQRKHLIRLPSPALRAPLRQPALSLSALLGVVFGANLGTTSTGCIVSVVGFKVSVAAMALPLLGLGALMRLLLKGRSDSAGLALAGFGVLFVGIDLL